MKRQIWSCVQRFFNRKGVSPNDASRNATPVPNDVSGSGSTGSPVLDAPCESQCTKWLESALEREVEVWTTVERETGHRPWIVMMGDKALWIAWESKEEAENAMSSDWKCRLKVYATTIERLVAEASAFTDKAKTPLGDLPIAGVVVFYRGIFWCR